jgi:hypothetical protein
MSSGPGQAISRAKAVVRSKIPNEKNSIGSADIGMNLAGQVEQAAF